MDYYFTAANDTEALGAKDLPGGPVPGSEGFDSVAAKGVLATALEELVSLAIGKDNQFVIAGTLPLWPKMPSNPEEYEPGSMLVRLPDSLRDELAELEVTPALAAKWAQELYGYEPEDAQRASDAIIELARKGLRSGRSIYWWSEM